ncbi:MAG TPA: transaldolase family protein [Candidatus Nanoarchaeia archaeon]|nr:transaldolase family protein [Candidatus Nanoarchaeia archaeon]
MAIKLFADTANLEEIAYCFSQGVDDGITTNPKIMETTGDLSLGFEGACKTILEKYPDVPVSLETDLRGIDVRTFDGVVEPEKVRDVLLQQAETLSSWGKNVIIKIPICQGGLLAAEDLAKRGIKTNITACMTPYQALEASKHGIGYVSLFANRMLDSYLLELAGHSLTGIQRNPDWKKLVAESRKTNLEVAWRKTLEDIAKVAQLLDNNPNSELIVGSIREPSDIYRIVQAEPQIITIPTKIVKGLDNILNLKQTKRSFKSNEVILGESVSHPMTQYTLEEFEKAADSYRK